VNGAELDGTNLDVQFSGEKPRPANGGGDEPCTTIFCGNLGFYTEESTIREFFAGCGEVKAVRISTDPDTGRAKGFCHVEFETADQANKAVADLNGH